MNLEGGAVDEFGGWSSGLSLEGGAVDESHG